MTRTVVAGSALFALAFVVAGCQFLEDNADVTKNVEIPITFTLDGQQLCKASNADGLNCENPKSESAPMDFPLGRFEHDDNIDVVERTGRTELRDLTGRFKEITISKVDHDFQSNTLTFTTPKINLHVGPKPATSTKEKEYQDRIVKLTTLPPVDPGKTPSGSTDVPKSAEKAASPLFKELEFSALPNGQPKVEKGDKMPPSGKAKIKVTMHVKFVANPADAAQN